MVKGKAAGLCAVCRWVRPISNRRGSDFFLCLRSKEEPNYPRYPRLPVLECRGFESRLADEVSDQPIPS